jgi:N-acetylneuraminate synthase
MSTLNDIQKAVEIFNSASCSFELMHTISTYPMEEKNANLRLISTLKDEFNCNVGYSGHESGLAVSYAAAAFGISSLERHITLDRSMYGSDQSASLEPAGFSQLIGGIRKIENALGDGVKKIVNEEIPIAKNLRQHLTWKGEIVQGNSIEK